MIVATFAHQHVVPQRTVKGVVVVAAIKTVSALSAEQEIIPGPAIGGVIAQTAENRIGAAIALKNVVGGIPDQPIMA
ncbi:MAG TPA: hypothetical protein VGU24_05075 [Microvirga sp.]|jgi:hypothetical protein|nr:hypothetical protein [Microvirga sp.]